MRLEALEAIPYSLPFREPYVTARGELTERRLILLRIRADGLEGLGETAALSLRGGPDLKEIARQLSELCRPALEEGPIDPQRLWSALARCRNRGVSPQALAAVDIALHDLAAKAARMPVWKLLGAERAEPVACNATLPAANPTRTRALAQEWMAEGFSTFKLKVGLPGDVTQVATVREELGGEAQIRVDANAAWTVEQAAERLQAMARHTIELAEQPVSGLDAMALLRSRTRIPLAADENVISSLDARRAVELDACELATVKLAKVGGIAEALEIARVLPVYLSSALEGPVAIAAAAHTVQALRKGIPKGLAHGLATARLFAATIGSGARLNEGRLELHDGPGLGVELDEAALAARRLDLGRPPE
jgi:L-Ala-D/L-Glu epimerase / N-acetyl-D-glutamate racemase